MKIKHDTPLKEQKVDRFILWRIALRRFLTHKLAVISFVILCAYGLLIILYPFLPFHSYKKAVPIHQSLPPSLLKTSGELLYEKKEKETTKWAQKNGRMYLNEKELQVLRELKHRINTQTYVDKNGAIQKVHQRRYLWGTDYLGRDLLSRVILGSTISITIGISGALCAVFIGSVIGAFAGFRGGTTDFLITRCIDVIYGLPYIFLVVIFIAFFGRNVFNLFMALICISWLTTARVVRGQVISLKNSEFVKMSQILGAPTLWIIGKHLIPNTLNVIIIFATLRIPMFIILESFLSFLGLGITPPLASWGTLISEAVDSMTSAPWQLFFPACMMFVFLLAMNFLGDGLRDIFDPRHEIK